MADTDFSGEEWRAIEGALGNSVSSFGRVRRRDGKLSKAGSNARGYRNVRLTINGRCEAYYVHRLVAMAFLGEPPSAKHIHVAHNDGSRDNNHVDNLRWATPTENSADRKVHGTHHVGERHHRAKLTDAQTAEIKASLEGCKVLSERYGISASRIVKIRGRLRAPNKRNWHEARGHRQPPAIKAS